jgi:hypothetical protein
MADNNFKDIFGDIFGGLGGSKGIDPKNPTAGLTTEKKVELQHQMVIKLGQELTDARGKTSEVIQAYNTLKGKHVELVRAHNALLTRVEALEEKVLGPK